MPSEIQSRIAHATELTLDTRISPLAFAVSKEVTATAVSATSSNIIEGRVREAENTTGVESESEIESQPFHVRLQKNFDALSVSYTSRADGMAKVGKGPRQPWKPFKIVLLKVAQIPFVVERWANFKDAFL
jgi:hypothetical protein